MNGSEEGWVLFPGRGSYVMANMKTLHVMERTSHNGINILFLEHGFVHPLIINYNI